MYRYFGGKLAVQAMDWDEFWAALQLLAEERVGTLIRREAARQDAAFQAAITPEPDE